MSGNVTGFYACLYLTIVLNPVNNLEKLSRNASTLLATKVADCVLAHSKEKGENKTRTCVLLHLLLFIYAKYTIIYVNS